MRRIEQATQRISMALIGLVGASALIVGQTSLASADTAYPPPVVSATSCSVTQSVSVGSTFTSNATCTFAPGSAITVTLNGAFYETLTAPATGILTFVIVVTDPHISMNGGPTDAASFGASETFIATGTNAAGATNSATAVIVIPAAVAGTGLAFTGADLAATFIGGAALLLMGALVTLYARRRASQGTRRIAVPTP
jgi:hypothetical protein